MALPCDEYVAEKFVDREDDFLKLTNLTANIPLPNRRQHVLFLVGNSNIGKTSLLCKYYNHLVDLGEFWAVFISLKDFKDCSLDRFAIEFLSKLYHRISITCGLLPNQILEGSTPTDLNLKVVNELLTNTPGDRPVVLLFDEVSMLSPDQLRLFENYFLRYCLDLPKVLVVLAGRYRVTTWNDFDLRKVVLSDADDNLIELRGFNYGFTEEQIKKIEEQLTELATKIHNISGGSPGYNRKIVEQLIRNNFQFDEQTALQACNQELYDAVQAAGTDLSLPPDQARELLPALEALCVLKDFDKDYEAPLLLAAHEGLQGEWTANRSNELLQNLSRIHVGAGKLVDWNGQDAYVVEEEARRTLEMELKLRNRALWTKLHTTAKEMYDEWARTFPPGEVFVGKSNYHLGRLSEKDK